MMRFWLIGTYLRYNRNGKIKLLMGLSRILYMILTKSITPSSVYVNAQLDFLTV